MEDSAHFTSYEPKQLDKIISVDSETTPFIDPHRDIISDFSRVTRESIRRVDLLLSRTFLVVKLLCRKKASHRKSCADREKERKEKVL